MRQKTIRFFFLIAATFLIVSSCKKDEANTDSEPVSPPDVTAPSYSFSRFDANGLLKVQRTFAYWHDPLNGVSVTYSAEAASSFKLSPFDSAFVDMGALYCQFKNVPKQVNNGYLLNGNAATAMSFGDTVGVDWNAAGNAVIGLVAFTFVTDKPMPVYYGITNNSIPTDITRSLGFQIPLGANLLYADSVFISLTVGQKSVKKTLGGLASSCAFSNTELSSLGASEGMSGLIQVTPLNFDAIAVGSKKVYAANQSNYTRFVTVK